MFFRTPPISFLEDTTLTPINTDIVHQEDVEYGIYESVFREIPFGHDKLIQGERFEALKNYIDLLEKYGPLIGYNTDGVKFLHALSQELKKSDSIASAEYRDLVTSIRQQYDNVFATATPFHYVNCKDSGYPCGLWTVFHVLTTNFAIIGHEEENQAKALQVIGDYVLNFFRCIECREHFRKMAKDRKLEEVKGSDEAILWLWRAHNKVNARLKDDPYSRQKIQYPSKESCPKCRYEDGNWNVKQVLKYMKQKYRSTKLAPNVNAN